MTAPVRIVLVEDNDGFREMLAVVLGMRPDVEVVAAVGDGAEAVPACAEHAPDVVLMDYRLPGLDGVQATRAVLEAAPATAVVCLAASLEPGELEALQDAGAAACLSKDQDLDEIVAAIRLAAERAGAA